MIETIFEPTKLESIFAESGKLVEVPLSTIYDIKADTSVQKTWQNQAVVLNSPDVHDPQQWNDKLHACMRGEFFAHVLSDCKHILDIGCGEGWPSLYLAQSLPEKEIVGIDLSPKHIALTQNTASKMGLNNVSFHTEHIEALPFDDEYFDGVCFGGNVFTYRSDTLQMLKQINRVLIPEGIFALEQWPVDTTRPQWERILWFIDGGAPIINYGAGAGPYSRSYFIYLLPGSEQGKRIADLSNRISGELSEEQFNACIEIKNEIESGAIDIVEKVLWSGQDRSLSRDELPDLLNQVGLSRDFKSWALPDAVAFAESLKDVGILDRLLPSDLLACLRALVKGARTHPLWIDQWVTCRKGI